MHIIANEGSHYFFSETWQLVRVVIFCYDLQMNSWTNGPELSQRWSTVNTFERSNAIYMQDGKVDPPQHSLLNLCMLYRDCVTY